MRSDLPPTERTNAEQLETISPESIKGKLPELTREQLESVKEAFLKDLRNGEILLDITCKRAFPQYDERKDNRQLTEEDLKGTGFKKDELVYYSYGSQPLFLKQCAEAYKKHTSKLKLPKEFLLGLIQQNPLQQNPFPSEGTATFFQTDSGLDVKGFDKSAHFAQQRKENENKPHPLFETRVGDIFWEIRTKNSGIAKPVKFAQLNIEAVLPEVDPRASGLLITAYLGDSNSKDIGNPSLTLEPEEQKPNSVAMLRRALKTDPAFLLNLFREFVPEAFVAGAGKNSNYYPTDGGKHNMRIVFSTPGLKTADFEEEIVTEKK